MRAFRVPKFLIDYKIIDLQHPTLRSRCSRDHSRQWQRHGVSQERNARRSQRAHRDKGVTVAEPSREPDGRSTRQSQCTQG